MRDFTRTTALAAALVATMLSVTAWADTKAGVDAWSRGDHEAAVKEWLGPAAKGARSVEEGVEEATEALDKGLAKALLDCWIETVK